LQSALDGKQAAGSYAPASHTHAYLPLTGNSDVSGYISFMAGVVSFTGPPVAWDQLVANSHPVNIAQSGARLTLSMGPVFGMIQTWSGRPLAINPNGNAVTINGRNVLDEIDGKAATSHSHSWSAITDKPTSFAPSAHSHAISEVTGLQGALDGKQAAGSYASASHGHAIGEVTGLQSALDGKAATSHTHSYLPLTGGALTGDVAVNAGVIQPREGFSNPWAGGDSGTYHGHYKWGYQEAGAWAHPFPDLILGYHTGMKLGAQTAYGGVRFYADHPGFSTTELFSVGKFDHNVRVTNQLFVNGRNILTELDGTVKNSGDQRIHAWSIELRDNFGGISFNASSNIGYVGFLNNTGALLGYTGWMNARNRLTITSLGVATGWEFNTTPFVGLNAILTTATGVSSPDVRRVLVSATQPAMVAGDIWLQPI
jgi:hypothetical protein